MIPLPANPSVRTVVMAFGDEPWRHLQAHWCLLGLLHHLPRPAELVVATDRPERYRWFGELVRVEPVQGARLAEWTAGGRYFLRALIECVRLAAALAPRVDVAMYCDADTVARSHLGHLVRTAAAGRIALDRREYVLARHRRRGSRRLWSQVGGRAWAGVEVGIGTAMWNTGVTVLPTARAALADRALAACDAMLAGGVEHYLTEQIAMSAVLGEGALEINPASRPPLIAHYWGNKEAWNDAIARRLAGFHIAGVAPLEAAALAVRDPVWLPLAARRGWWRRLLGAA